MKTDTLYGSNNSLLNRQRTTSQRSNDSNIFEDKKRQKLTQGTCSTYN